MALNSGAIVEVAASGSDGNAGNDLNAGMFDPINSQANWATNLTTDANTGNTSAPVVSSASFNFVAGDVNSWLFSVGGASWTLPNVAFAGGTTTPVGLWNKVTSVASNKATVDAAVGHAVCQGTGGPYALNDTLGVSTQATPSSGKGTMDYSQVGTPIVSAADLAGTSANTAAPVVTSASRTFVLKDVGNHIQISAGTNWTTGVYRIISISAGAATLDRACASVASPTAGTYREGGCYASPGTAGQFHVGGMHIYLKNGTYTLASASSNVSTGCVTLASSPSVNNLTAIIGYNALRVDAPKTTSRPTIIANGVITSFNVVSLAADSAVHYCILDGNNRTTSRGIQSSGWATYVSAKNFTNGAFVSMNFVTACDATTCSSNPAFNAISLSALFCAAWSNTNVGFEASMCFNCISVNNSGASSHGFEGSGVNYQCVNCTAFGNGGIGFRAVGSNASLARLVNCIAYSNTSAQFNAANANTDLVMLINCAAGNSSNFLNFNNDTLVGCISLAADPFINSAGGNFGLSTTAAGLACQGAGMIGAFPGLPSTSTFLDVGAVDHTDPSASVIVTRRLTIMRPITMLTKRVPAIVQQQAPLPIVRRSVVYLTKVVPGPRRVVTNQLHRVITQRRTYPIPRYVAGPTKRAVITQQAQPIVVIRRAQQVVKTLVKSRTAVPVAQPPVVVRSRSAVSSVRVNKYVVQRRMSPVIGQPPIIANHPILVR